MTRPPRPPSLPTLLLSSLLPLAVGLAGPASGQVRNIRFERIATEDGLSQADVYSILQDRQGFMWFATQYGLNRYDGYSFEHLLHDPYDPSTLSHNFIYAVIEDRHGIFWIGTMGGGLNRWNPENNTLNHYRHDPADPTSLSNDRIRVLLEDREGFVWIGTDGGGLNRFESATGTFARFIHNPAEPDSLSTDRILAVYQDSGGTFWVGTDGGGLNRFEPETETFSKICVSSGPGQPCADRVWAILEDRDGLLWIGTYERGLFRYDRASETSRQFLHDPGDPESLSSNWVRSIFQDDLGTIWVGTDAGLNEWNPAKETFSRYQNNPANSSSLSDNRVISIYQDRGGVLWFGTEGGGLSKWNPRSGVFSSFQRDPSRQDSLSSNTVAAFAEGPDGEIYIGTYGGGVNRLDRSTARITHYRHDPERADSLNDDRVMALLVDLEDVLWVGTLEGGLDRLDRKSQTFSHFVHDPDDPHSLSGNSVVSLLEDRKGYLWVGTSGGGLSRLDRSSGVFVRYRHDPENPTSLSGDLITALYEDHAGGLWVGTETEGLNRFDPNTGSFTHYRRDLANPWSLSNDTIYCLLEDRRGFLWIGTQAGLNRWEPRLRAAYKEVFKHYAERQGLPNSSIFGILEDEKGHLWLSSNNGLSRLDPKSETFKNFDVSHGLLNNEFNIGAYFRHSSGELFFGGNQGFNSFFPDRISTNKHVAPVVLTSFLKFNQPVQLDRPISELDAIELTHKDYVVSFEFAALDYTAPEKNRYAYMLEGFDSDWIEIGTIRRATYTNLDPGDYVFRVKAANNDGVWNEAGVALAVTVVSPPWQRSWAYTLYVVAVLLAILAYGRAQKRKLDREAEYTRKLENEVQDRIRELAEKNDALLYMNKRLEEASVTDSLTGLKNRRFLLNSIQRDIGLVERYYAGLASSPESQPVVRPDLLFLIFDLDRFKEVNDTYGHGAGDRVLVQVRDLLQHACRDSDTLIRWGGDEFLVVGRDTDQTVAEGLAERIRSAIAEHSFDLGSGHRVSLNCSIGFSGYPFMPAEPTGLHWEQVVGIADRALYIAKQSGRNQWVGIFGTDRTSNTYPDDLVMLVNERTEALAQEGMIEIRTSLDDHDALVWARA